MKFSERLRRAREHAGLTQEALAQRSGVKQGTISKIERGESESSTFVVQLAIACGVRCEWLAVETGKMLEQALRPDEQVLLDNYRAVGDPEKVAIDKVAESLARPYIAASSPWPTKAPAVTKAPEQINDNPGRLPDEHLHIKIYSAGSAKSERKKTAGGKPAVED